MKASNYDKRPRVDIPRASGCAWRGWGAIAVHLREEMSKLRAQGGRVLAIECYTVVFEAEIRLAAASMSAADTGRPPVGFRVDTQLILSRSRSTRPAVLPAASI